MKKHLFLFFGVFFLMIGLVGVWWNEVTKPPSNNGESIGFVVAKGKGAAQIANDLYKAELIKSPLAFKFYVQLTGNANRIPAGIFEISKNLSMFEVLDKLSGRPLEIKVTIKEGLRKEEVVEELIKQLGMEAENATEFRKSFNTNSEEGYLYPETYYFHPEVTGEQVVNRMRGLFNSTIEQLMPEIEKSELSLDEIVTLASIIERETKTDEERPTVAGVFLNRLEIGMALQADATAQYAVSSARCKVQGAKCANWWIPPTLVDLEINSPYNTYKFTGIPPAPISSPGFSSIEAVVRPKESDYLYYIHESNGTIHYARTLSEHNTNIAKYLR
jgi:UPF0755 protein